MAGRFRGPGAGWRRGRISQVGPAATVSEAWPADDGADEAQLELFDVLAVPDEASEPADASDTTDEREIEPTRVPSCADLLTPELIEAYGLSRASQFSLEPRPYQEEAIGAWARNGGQGVIVLPTGAGKTVVALAILARLNVRALVVVPTIDLLHQWREAIAERLGFPLSAIGMIGGGKRTMRDITVITYDSASLPSRRLDGFGLLIVDEVHHLPARAYRTIAAKSSAPFRLGLSATPERSDHGHTLLPALVGPVVYRRTAAELARESYIAAYEEKRIFVDLSPEERLRYEECMAHYRWYIATHRALLGGEPGALFAGLIQRSGHDPAARAALRAHHEARMIALNARAKLAKVAELLQRHRNDKVLIFSEYTSMVDMLSEAMLLPAITYRTPLVERRRILDRYRAGELSKLVTGRVLNEGVDVPDANVAIVVSGSSATREYIQRLGRILRPKDSTAVLYELVTRKTTEGRAARKRRSANKK